jgi:hypothetical protein
MDCIGRLNIWCSGQGCDFVIAVLVPGWTSRVTRAAAWLVMRVEERLGDVMNGFNAVAETDRAHFGYNDSLRQRAAERPCATGEG